jgi:hypothetical protein
MANGIDWFRWHHGSVTDPKFQLVARRAGCRLPDVIAVWAFVLEQASSSNDRGAYGDLDFESIDLLMGFDDGVTQRIVVAMEARGLLADGLVAAWTKRQVKRERTDDNSTERVKAFREKKRQETPEAGCETPRNAMERQETPREEKSREDKEEAKASLSTADADDAADQASESLPPCPHTEILRLFAEHLPELPQPRAELWDGERAKALKARWRWCLTAKRGDGRRYATNRDEALQWFGKFFGYVRRCPHLMGENSRSWTADLGWLVKADNFAKVQQGNYDSKEIA